MFPPAQIGFISREVLDDMRKIKPITDFMHEIPQPKPLHKDSATGVPTPGRFEISEQALKRKNEDITPLRKRLANEGIKETETSVSIIKEENEPFKAPLPEVRNKVPPWKSMSLRINQRSPNFYMPKGKSIP